MRECLQCKRTIRTDSTKAVYLWDKPDGSSVWVCGKRCLDTYGEGEDNAGDQMNETYKPGDVMPDGRTVVEVDDEGHPTVVAKAKKPQVSSPQPEDEEPQRLSEVVAAATEEKRTRKPRASKKTAVDPAVVREKLAAASKPVSEDPDEDASETQEEEPEMKSQKKTAKKTKATKAAKPAKVAKAKASSARKGNKWTPEAVKKYKAQIKAGETTYMRIAEALGITYQTVWATLNRKK